MKIVQLISADAANALSKFTAWSSQEMFIHTFHTHSMHTHTHTRVCVRARVSDPIFNKCRCCDNWISKQTHTCVLCICMGTVLAYAQCYYVLYVHIYKWLIFDWHMYILYV